MSGCSSHGNVSQCNAAKTCMWNHKHHHCVSKGSPHWKIIGIVLGSIVVAAGLAVLIWFLVTKSNNK